MSTVMQCVQELKAWQESQKEILQESASVKSSRNNIEDELQIFDIADDVQENPTDDEISSCYRIDEKLLNNLRSFKIKNQNEDDNFSTISELDENLIMKCSDFSKRNSSPNHFARDELVILSPNKNFAQTCKIRTVNDDEKMNSEKAKDLKDNFEVQNKNPKPFLKKGAGLARYGLNFEEVKNKKGRLKFRKPQIIQKVKIPKKKTSESYKTSKTSFNNKVMESNRLDLNKVMVETWNRYEPKDEIINEDFEIVREQKELHAFEILEERANDSNFNAASPSVHQLLQGTSNFNSNKEVQVTGTARSLNFNQVNTSTPNRQLKDSDDEYSDSSQEYDPLDLIEVNKKCIYSDGIQNTKSTNKNNQPQLTEDEKKYLDNFTLSKPVKNDYNFEQSFDTEILAKRLVQLESEIETFRTENAKLAKLQQDFEVERKKFFKSKDDFLKKIDEEKKNNEEKLAEEKKKFAKEKAIFEKNSRELKNRPTRQEREEIKTLKEQLAELKEELNKKESRWAAGQARLRNQMKVLENANTALKNELELVRKASLNKKVTFKSSIEKQAMRNTKILHNVNNEISKLTLDDVSSMVDPRSKKVPPSILRKPSIKLTESYESSEDNSSNSSQSNENILTGNSDNLTKIDDYNSDSGVIRETVLDDGRKEILYSNGNFKKISADGKTIKTIYYNGDVKETNESSERYYFSENKTYHTTFNDGLEIIEFPNGQIEKHYINGTIEIEYVDGKKHTIYPDGKEIWNYLDGSCLTINSNGCRELVFQNGQREIHTNEYKKRIFPDGTTKIIYSDGSQETKYSDGRIRKKDKDGNLTLDFSAAP
ncbi:centromere protein J isoform X2 [Daktulosphaira vitifoliae]|nr:centromere protein J isoform X2 [Daktulosphaira vitifoliae]